MPGPHKLSEGLLDKEIALAITEDRRIEGRTKLRATTKLVTMLVWSVLMSIGVLSTESSAQIVICNDCENVVFEDCDGTPAAQPILVQGGDIAGTVSPTGEIGGDGFVNQFDVVRLIDLYYKNIYTPCADLDGSLTLNLGPVTIGGVEYCGDLVLMRKIFGPCQASCRTPQGDNPCNVASPEPGCTDANCCALVCSIDDVCCEPNGWDAQCVNLANANCNRTGGDCLIPSTTGGCLSAPCELAVCAQNPLCCEFKWDQSCVDLAGLLCLELLCLEENLNNPDDCALLTCGEPGLESCTLPHASPGCSDPACCALVCQADPFCCDTSWDLGCARAASETCAGPTAYCGVNSSNPNCFAPNLDILISSPGCQDFDCCSLVCQFDPFCCLVTWDQTCALNATDTCARYPNCGAIGTRECTEILGPDDEAPDVEQGCSDINCCNNVCSIDPTCCTVAWDNECALIALDECTNCGDRNAGSCFDDNNNTPGCNNRLCCERICAFIDPFCCDEAFGNWDQQCASLAEATCPPPESICGSFTTRSCFLTNDSPGCRQPACCAEVCQTFDLYCCEVAWDAICATTALSVQSCTAANDYQALGPCLEAHPGKGCNVPACAAAVCALPGEFAYLCCEIQWDQNCADLAQELCYDLLVCPTDAPCDQAHQGVGCEDPFCCSYVCEVDPSCCTTGWDTGCAQLSTNCIPDTVDINIQCPCDGSCFEARLPGENKPGCEDGSCCAVVCSIDPSCCYLEDPDNPGTLGNWGANCVALAEQYCCNSSGGCGDHCAGGCLQPSETPNCNDPACCAAVCAIDPYCCETRWDSNCALLAFERCTSGCGIPTSGSCFVGKLGSGCEDPECCTAICTSDPYCCQVSWDSGCVTAAKQTPASCTLPTCGAFGTGECCQVNGTPSCNDSACCEAVCLLDAFCCEGSWDEVCVSLARDSLQCNGPGCLSGSENCGNNCAGDCCTANGTPLCNDEACCQAVCLLDAFCCNGEWDLYCAEQARFTCSYNGEANGSSDITLDACPAPKCGELGSGSCCLPNGTPLCDDKECCDAVGLIDPYCTTVSWDEACVTIATTTGVCDCDGGTSCGDPAAGDCCVANDTPYCNNNACCTTVCTIDPTCCTIFWSQDCVIWADFYCTDICAGGGAPVPVFEPPLPSTAFPSSKVKSKKPKAKPVSLVQPVGAKPSKK